VQLQERVNGSAFERYYVLIKQGIHFISKLGGFFVGDVNAEKLLDTIKTKVTQIEQHLGHRQGSVRMGCTPWQSRRHAYRVGDDD